MTDVTKVMVHIKEPLLLTEMFSGYGHVSSSTIEKE